MRHFSSGRLILKASLANVKPLEESCLFRLFAVNHMLLVRLGLPPSFSRPAGRRSAPGTPGRRRLRGEATRQRLFICEIRSLPCLNKREIGLSQLSFVGQVGQDVPDTILHACALLDRLDSWVHLYVKELLTEYFSEVGSGGGKMDTGRGSGAEYEGGMMIAGRSTSPSLTLETYPSSLKVTMLLNLPPCLPPLPAHSGRSTSPSTEPCRLGCRSSSSSFTSLSVRSDRGLLHRAR
jgi:hypothetical protein